MAYARPLQGRRQMPMDGEQKQICRFFVKTGVCTRYKSKLIINKCGKILRNFSISRNFMEIATK